MINKIKNNENAQAWAAVLGLLVLNFIFGAVGGA